MALADARLPYIYDCDGRYQVAFKTAGGGPKKHLCWARSWVQAVHAALRHAEDCLIGAADAAMRRSADAQAAAQAQQLVVLWGRRHEKLQCAIERALGPQAAQRLELAHGSSTQRAVMGAAGDAGTLPSAPLPYPAHLGPSSRLADSRLSHEDRLEKLRIVKSLYRQLQAQLERLSRQLAARDAAIGDAREQLAQAHRRIAQLEAERQRMARRLQQVASWQKADSALAAGGQPGMFSSFAEAVNSGGLQPGSVQADAMRVWLRRAGGTRAQWPGRVKCAAALARNMHSADSAVDVLSAALFPLPSASTCRRTVAASSPDPGFGFVGISQGTISRLLRDGYATNCLSWVAKLDLTCHEPRLSIRHSGDTAYFEGDAVMGTPGSDEQLRAQEHLYCQQYSALQRYLAGQPCYSTAAALVECTLAPLLAWVTGTVLPDGEAALVENEHAVAARLSRYERRNGDESLLPGQKAALQQVQAASTKLRQHIADARSLAAKVRSLIEEQPPEVYCELQLGDCGLAAVQLVPVAPSVQNSWAAAARGVVASALAALEGLHSLLRAASTLLLLVILEDTSKQHSEIVAAMWVAGRMKAAAFAMSIAEVKAAFEAAAAREGLQGVAELLAVSADGEGYEPLHNQLPGAPTNPMQVAVLAREESTQLVRSLLGAAAAETGTRSRAHALPHLYAATLQTYQATPPDKYLYLNGAGLPVRKSELELTHLSGRERLLEQPPGPLHAALAAGARPPSASVQQRTAGAKRPAAAPGTRRQRVQRQRPVVHRPNWAAKQAEPSVCGKCDACKQRCTCVLLLAWRAAGTEGFEAALADLEAADVLRGRMLNVFKSKAAQCKATGEMEAYTVVEDVPVGAAEDDAAGGEEAAAGTAASSSRQQLGPDGPAVVQWRQTASTTGLSRRRAQDAGYAATAAAWWRSTKEGLPPRAQPLVLEAQDLHGSAAMRAPALSEAPDSTSRTFAHTRVLSSFEQLNRELHASPDPQPQRLTPRLQQQLDAFLASGEGDWLALWAQLPRAEGTAVLLRAHCSGQLVSAGAAQRLYTATVLAFCYSSLGLNLPTAFRLLGEFHQQCAFDRRFSELKQLGVDFSSHVHQPAGVAVFMDEDHKLKNLVQGIQNQDVEAAAADQRLLPLPRLLEATRSLVALYQQQTPQQRGEWEISPEALLRVLLAYTDKQNTYCAKVVFAVPELAAALRQLGEDRTAAALEVWGAAAVAMDTPGLTSRQRSLAVHSRTLMLARLLGDWLFVPQTIPQQLKGISSNILLSQLMNADARLLLLSAMSPDEAQRVCEHALGTNACEGAFGVVTQHAGRKQSPAELKGVLRSISYTARQRSMPAARRGFALPKRAAKSWYQQYSNQPDGSSWNQRSAPPGRMAAALVLGVRARSLKLGARLRTVAKADKYSSLRDKAGYKLKH